MAQVGRFRDSLDLTEVLPAYREHLSGDYGGTAGINFIDGNGPSIKDPFENEAIPRSLYARHRTVEDPVQIGDGPTTCSTCTDLVLARPTFAWDVNGWYRTLGVPWPYVDATSGSLSRAYIAAGGQNSARATYYLKRLLDRPTRAFYDLTALGVTYLDDQYIQDAMKADAQQEASRRSATGTYTDAVSVLDEWGYLLQPDDEGVVDSAAAAVQDEPTPEDDGFEPAEWTYSYWLWRSFGQTRAVIHLEQWQALLVSALSGAGARVNLAVGLMGHLPNDYTVGRFDEHHVVFLNEKVEPTQEMAERAAQTLLFAMSKI